MQFRLIQQNKARLIYFNIKAASERIRRWIGNPKRKISLIKRDLKIEIIDIKIERIDVKIKIIKYDAISGLILEEILNIKIKSL